MLRIFILHFFVPEDHVVCHPNASISDLPLQNIYTGYDRKDESIDLPKEVLNAIRLTTRVCPGVCECYSMDENHDVESESGTYRLYGHTHTALNSSANCGT